MRKQFLSHLIDLVSKKLRFGSFLDQLRIRSIRNSNVGFSVIEVILAAAIFMIFATGAVGVVIQGLSSNRLGEEQTVATQYASEGLEAVRSIKNRGFSNLVNSSGTGLARSGTVWVFSGSNNTFTPKPGKTYTRVIKVEPVYRNANGDIVTSGGTLDNLSKKITSTVTWSFSPARNNSVVLTTYLTNYRKPIVANGGLLSYADSTSIPKFRIYETSNDQFSSEVSTNISTSGLNFVIRTSPLKSEAIAGYETTGGDLHILCYNGEAWSEEWVVSVGGNGSSRRYDIAYETNSGDAMVLYSTNLTNNNELAYRTKPGSSGCGTSNWTGASYFDPVRTANTIHWVKMAWDKRSSSNLITAIWADSASDLSAAVWSGTAWGNEPSAVTENSLEIVGVPQDVESFDVEYESLSGNVMLVWGRQVGAGINGVYYRRCIGGTATCTWTSPTIMPTFQDDATNLDISANPATNEIVFASIGNAQSDLQLGYWNGSSWTNKANVDLNCNTPIAYSREVATGWLISGSNYRSVIVYQKNNSNKVNWYTGNGSNFSQQKDFAPTPSFANGQYLNNIEMNPLEQNALILLTADGNNDLFAKQLMLVGTNFFWSNVDNSTALEVNLPGSVSNPFAFAYWRNLAE